MRVIRGGVGMGMCLTPLLPPNFLVSNGATSYDAHPLSYDRKAKRLSTPNPSPKDLQLAATKAPQNAHSRPGEAIRSHLGVTRAKWGLD